MAAYQWQILTKTRQVDSIGFSSSPGKLSGILQQLGNQTYFHHIFDKMLPNPKPNNIINHTYKTNPFHHRIAFIIVTAETYATKEQPREIPSIWKLLERDQILWHFNFLNKQNESGKKLLRSSMFSDC